MKPMKLFALAIVLSLVGMPVLPAMAQGDILDQPVTLEVSLATNHFTEILDVAPVFDPSLLQNLYLPLFSYDLETKLAIPRLVENYSVSDDGLLFTFTLRPDIQWVTYRAGKVESVRPVTAGDVVETLYQRCSEVDYSLESYQAIQGCDGSARASGIQVIDDTTFTIALSEPASYLPIALTDPRVMPQPVVSLRQGPSVLDGLLSTGPFVLQSHKITEGQRTLVFIRNPFLPEDLRGEGNVERVVIRFYEGQQENWQEVYQRSIDEFYQGRSALLIQGGFSGTLGDITIAQSPADAVRFLVFNPDKPPFDNVQVRRAFSAAIDRSEIAFGRNEATHFGAPAISGSIPPDSADMLGFDPDYARAQLAEAGYPDCEGLPPITMAAHEYEAESLASLAVQFNRVLGCDENLFEIIVPSYDEYYRTIEGDRLARRLPGQVPSPTNQTRPHLWMQQTFSLSTPAQATNLGFELDCTKSTLGVPCTGIEALIAEANAEYDPEAQSALWHDIEEMLFGRDGQFPVAPLDFIYPNMLPVAPWAKGNPVTYYGEYGNWTAMTVEEQQRQEIAGLVIEMPQPGQAVALNETGAGTITQDQPAVAFTIPASGEEEISIQAYPTDGSKVDPVLTVYDADGNLVATNDDMALLTRTAHIGGLSGTTEYVAVVYPFDLSVPGDFELRVSGGMLSGAVTGGGNVNVRSGPGTNFNVVMTAAPGTEIAITGRNADTSWLKVTIDGTEGWLAEFLVTSEGDLTRLPVVE